MEKNMNHNYPNEYHDLEYQYLLDEILKNGKRKENRTGIDTIGILGFQMQFSLKEAFPLLTTKKLPLRWIFEELKWFLSGSTDVRDLQKAGVDIWNEWATETHNGKHGRAWWNMGPIYSHQWRNFGASPISDYDGVETHPDAKLIGCKSTGYWLDGFDQIAWLSKEFKARSNSRRLILSGWNPAEADLVALPPCHTFSQFTVDGDELHCHMYQRSADVFLGVPFNIASYALLTEMFAKSAGLKAGKFIHTIHDAHIYVNHLDQVREQKEREAPRSPVLEIEEGVENVWDYQWKHITLKNYNPLSKLVGEVAV